MHDDYLSTYFYNLRTNFPSNTHGTCGFTGISMLLSYFDSFWHDDFIEETYDKESVFSTSGSLDGRPIIPSDCESPGVRNEPVASVSQLSNYDYLRWSKEHSEDYLQSYFIDIADTMFGYPFSDDANDPFGLDLYKETALLNYHNVYKRGLNSGCVVASVLPENSTNKEIERYLQNYLQHGIPVLLNVEFNSDSPLAFKHAVIAYDYANDVPTPENIFVHPGWFSSSGENLTHVTLSQLCSGTGQRYRIESGLTMEPRIDRQCGDNYRTESGQIALPEDMVIPHNFRLVSPFALDYSPVFEWDRTTIDSWRRFYDVSIEITVLASDGSFVCSQNKKVDAPTIFAMPCEAWEYLTLGDTGGYYTIRAVMIDNGEPLDYGETTFDIRKPATYSGAVSFGPSDLALQGINSSEQIALHEVGGLPFESRRVNCGSFLDFVMFRCSRTKKRSFLTLNFSRPVLRIDLKMQLMSPAAAQAPMVFSVLTSSGDDNQLVTEFTGLNGVNSSICTWRAFSFSKPVTSVSFEARFIGLFPLGNYSNNQAGLLVSDFAVWDRLPPNGSEIEYQPEIWNVDPIVEGTNCYSYAVNCQVDPSGALLWGVLGKINGLGRAVSFCNPFSLKNGLEGDFANVNGLSPEDPSLCLFFKEVGRFEVCPDGMYKIACAFSDGDYHFYRQNKDGYWSEKDAKQPVTDLFNGERIIDPSLLERVQYPNFLGYFAIKPIGGLYHE